MNKLFLPNIREFSSMGFFIARVLLAAALCGMAVQCSPSSDEDTRVKSAEPAGGAADAKKAPEVDEAPDAAWRKIPLPVFKGWQQFMEVGYPGDRARARFGYDGRVQTGPVLSLWIHDFETETTSFPTEENRSFNLMEGYLPLPRVRWPIAGGAEAETELMTLHTEDDTFHLLRVKLFNPGEKERWVRLMVGISPHGMNKEISRYDSIHVKGNDLLVDQTGWLSFSRKPVFFGTFNEVMESFPKTYYWEDGEASGTQADESQANPMAVCAFDFLLSPKHGEFAHAAHSGEMEILLSSRAGSTWPDFDEVRKLSMKTRLYWQHEAGLEKPGFLVPNRNFCDAFRSAVATLMLAWGRADHESPADLALASVALARAGQFEAARGILDSLDLQDVHPKRSQENRKETASDTRTHGLILFALADFFAFTRDGGWLGRIYPSAAPLADSLAGSLEARLAGEESTGQGAAPGVDLKEFIDLAWAIHGIEAAARLADGTNHPDDAARFRGLAERGRKALDDQIQQTMTEHDLGFIPVSEEVPNPSSRVYGQAAYFWPSPLLDRRNRWVRKSFDHYWSRRFGAPGSEKIVQSNYRSADIELAWAMIALGRREEALKCLEWLLDHQIVPGSYRWSEFPGVDPERIFPPNPSIRAAAGYVIAFRMLFIKERGGALVLAPGLPRTWIDYPEDLGIREAPTHHGTMSYTLKTREGVSDLALDSAARPPEGFILAPVLDSVEPEVEIDGREFRADLDFKRRQVIPIPAGTLTVRVFW
jgi:hypothetical protein